MHTVGLMQHMLLLSLLILQFHCDTAAQATTEESLHFKLMAESWKEKFHGEIMIMGCAGFIGYHLVRTLHAAGVKRLYCIDNFNVDIEYSPSMKRLRASKLYKKTGIKLFEGDITSHNDLVRWKNTRGVFKSGNLQHVVLAGVPSDSSRRNRYDVAVKGFRAILEMILRINFSQKTPIRFTYLLPAPEIGIRANFQNDELRKEMPNLFSSLCPDLDGVGVALTSVYGPFDRPDGQMYQLLDHIVKNETIHVTNADLFPVHYTYVDDAVHGILHVMAAENRSVESSSKVVDIVSSERSPLQSVIKTLSKLVDRTAIVKLVQSKSTEDQLMSRGRRPPKKRSYSDLAIGLLSHNDVPSINETISAASQDQAYLQSLPSITTTHEEYGFQAGVDIHTGLSKLVDWYNMHHTRRMPCASECHAHKLCHASSWDKPAAVSSYLTQGCSYVLYTVDTADTTNAIHSVDPINAGPQLCNIAFISEKSPLVTRLRMYFQEHGEERDEDSEDDTDDDDPERFKQLDINADNSSFSYSGYRKNDLDEEFTSKAKSDSDDRYEEEETNDRRGKNRRRQLEASVSDGVDYFRMKYWIVIPVSPFSDSSDPRKPSRVPKLSPSKFFAMSVEYVVYLDTKLKLLSNPKHYIAMMKPDYEGNENRDIILLAVRIGLHVDVFIHFDHILSRIAERPSITYYESVLKQQERAYKGYASRYDLKFRNLFDGAFIVHDLKSKGARRFRCRWYNEYLDWADRDQVAATFVMSTGYMNVKNGPDVGAQEYVPVDFHRSGRNVARHQNQPTSMMEGFSQEDILYVRILSHHTYHWQESEKVGRLKFFDYQREDDKKISSHSKTKTGGRRRMEVNGSISVPAEAHSSSF